MEPTLSASTRCPVTGHIRWRSKHDCKQFARRLRRDKGQRHSARRCRHCGSFHAVWTQPILASA